MTVVQPKLAPVHIFSAQNESKSPNGKALWIQRRQSKAGVHQSLAQVFIVIAENALDQIHAQWNANDTFGNRVGNLATGFLSNNNVHDDKERDWIFGGDESDWQPA